MKIKTKKEILEKLKELYLFFHHVGMDYTGELAKKYSVAHGHCQLRTQNDFIIAEGVSGFITEHLNGILSDSQIPDVGKEVIEKFNLREKKDENKKN